MGYNSTIITKKKICLGCGRTDYIFSKGRCKQCATVESFAKRQSKEIEEEGLSDLIIQADYIFSQWVRLSGSDAKGICSCYTCGYKAPYTQMQNGHFKSRSHLFLRFDHRNTRIQCENCNIYKSGNMSKFASNLERDNIGIVEILNEESHTIYHWSRSELISIISEYQNKVNILKQKIKT